MKEFREDVWFILNFGCAKLKLVVKKGCIYNMTFFGFTEDQLSHERKKLEESIAELKEIEKLPKEERDKHFKSAAEVFAELGWNDERTEDEKEQERCILYREVLVNQIRTYRVLENFIKKDKSGTSFL